MPEVLALLLIMFFLLSIGLAISLSAFAFSDPLGFSKWAPLANWIFNLRASTARARSLFSGIVGGIFLGLSIILSFLFGSLVTTFTFDIWGSPLMKFLTGD